MDGKVRVYLILHHYPSLPHNKGYLPDYNSLPHNKGYLPAYNSLPHNKGYLPAYNSLPHNKGYLPAYNSLRHSPLVQYPIQKNWLYQQCFRLKTFVLLF